MFVLWGRAEKLILYYMMLDGFLDLKIEDTFETFKKAWFGSSEDEYIDSYKKIQYIDVHKINLKKCWKP